MSNLHDRHERTYCACRQCQAACRTMPGPLAPGDIDRIAAYVGVDMEDPEQAQQFIAGNFFASEGALVAHAGRTFRIPTIVPAQHPDGRCVFLTQDPKTGEDRCGIHPVAPFGCSRFNVCEPWTPEADAVSAAMLQEIIGSVDYLMTWGWIHEHGREAPPLMMRRAALDELCTQILSAEDPPCET